jgi:AraC-like DNA-binding protein/mannose-6-phosphate isomerase-like protein (cupin superfamily)
MDMLAYCAYESTRFDDAGFETVHGRYDGLTTGLWAHTHWQLLIPLRGRVQLTWGQESRLLGPERAALIPPRLPHAATTLGGELEFLAVNAPADWLDAVATELGTAPPSDVTVLADPNVWHVGRQLASALGGHAARKAGPALRRPGFARVVAAGLAQLAVYALQGADEPVDQAAPDPVLLAIDTMLRDYARPLTVEGLAAASAMSPRHFERRFKALTGLPPRRFLIGVRLAAARDLLHDSDATVEAIAGRVGFGDVAHFTRTFTAHAGLSPTAFRRARRAAGID